MSFHPIKGVPPVVYDADPRSYHAPQKAKRGTPEFTMSRTELVAFGKCPSKWLAGAKEDEPDEKTTAAMHFGDLFDVCVLTPHLFEARFAICPETYTAKGKKKDDPDEEKPWNRNATACKDWEAEREAEGFTVVKPGKAAEAWQAAKRHLANEHISEFHYTSRKQVLVQVQWEDEATGLCIPFKAMLDLVPDPSGPFGDTLADTKTTRDANHRKWTRQVYLDALQVQAAIYMDAINAALGTKYRCFEHHITENVFPFETTHRMLSDDFIQGHTFSGREVYTSFLREYCASVKSGKWRGLGTAAVDVEKWMGEEY